MIVKVHYPDSKNYEGVKILVYRDIKWNELLVKNKHAVDPHFGEDNNFISPIARFVPTPYGWEMAHEFCKIIT